MRPALSLECRATLFLELCTGCGGYARQCELLGALDRICCARCSHADTLFVWRVELLALLESRAHAATVGILADAAGLSSARMRTLQACVRRVVIDGARWIRWRARARHCWQ